MKTLHLPAAKDGVIAIDQINESDYRNAEGLNKSLLVKFMKSPRHYLAALNESNEPTDSMKMGTALHSIVLRDDPSRFFAVKKKVDNRTKEGKEYTAQFESENRGKAIINEEQHETVLGMQKSLMKNDRFRTLLEKTTHREMGIFSDYKVIDHRFRIKGMIDGYSEHDGIVWDLKTSQDASFDSFKWDFKKYMYDLQQVHYTQLVHDAALPFTEFLFVVIENKPPYEVAFYTLEMESYMKSRNVWLNAMHTYAHCHAKQDFDIGYPSNTCELSY